MANIDYLFITAFKVVQSRTALPVTFTLKAILATFITEILVLVPITSETFLGIVIYKIAVIKLCPVNKTVRAYFNSSRKKPHKIFFTMTSLFRTFTIA
jgi:hypothetical protein